MFLKDTSRVAELLTSQKFTGLLEFGALLELGNKQGGNNPTGKPGNLGLSEWNIATLHQSVHGIISWGGVIPVPWPRCCVLPRGLEWLPAWSASHENSWPGLCAGRQKGEEVREKRLIKRDRVWKGETMCVWVRLEMIKSKVWVSVSLATAVPKEKYKTWPNKPQLPLVGSGEWSSRTKGLNLHTKISVYQAVVMTTLLYSCETWPIYTRNIRMLEAFRIRWL